MPGTVGRAKRGGVGVGVGAGLHNVRYVKATPAGSGRAEPEDGAGQGLRRIRNFLSDGGAARHVTGPAREGRDWRGPCLAERTARYFFYGAQRSEKNMTRPARSLPRS